MNDYESLLPNTKVMFNILVARTASSSITLAVSSFIADGSFKGAVSVVTTLVKC